MHVPRLVSLRRARWLSAPVTALLALGMVPAEEALPIDPSVPITSANVDLVFNLPDAGAISAAVSPSEPVLVVSTLHGVDIYDISDPRLPVPMGTQPLPIWENEGMDYGERENGTKFVVVGYDDGGYSQLGWFPEMFVDGTATTPLSRLAVVDVTNPMLPTIASTIQLGSGTHTLSCVNAACTHVYSSGEGSFSIVDLTDISNPVEVDTHAGMIGLSHDWDLDGAGILWNVGIEGLAAYDVSDPVNPVILNSSTSEGNWDYPLLPGEEPRGEWNNYVLHNSHRPHARAFSPHKGGGWRADELGLGEVLLLTEEDYGTKPCATAGSFQTWHVPALDPAINPDGVRGGGTVEPLDLWVPELLDGSTDVPAVGAFCSAHYFDYHQEGFVAQAWYQQGVRLLDVRDPRDIQQIGWFFTGASEAWDAYWIPQRDEAGRTIVDATGETVKTNIVYVLDAVRGLDVLQVDLPETDRKNTKGKRAPVHPKWTEASAEEQQAIEDRKDPVWSFACPLPLRTN